MDSEIGEQQPGASPTPAAANYSGEEERAMEKKEIATTAERTPAETLSDLVSRGQALAQKHSYVHHGFERLIVALNQRLATVPDCDAQNILYPFPLRRFEAAGGDGVPMGIGIELVFCDDAKVRFQKMTYMRTEEKRIVGWEHSEELTPDQLSTQSIRAFGEQLPAILTYFAAHTQSREATLAPVIAVFDQVLDALRSEPPASEHA